MFVTNHFTVLLVVWILCAFVQAQKCAPHSDPCYSWMHVPFPQEDNRHPSIPWQPSIIDQCDVYSLWPDVWYKSDYNMTTSCPGTEKCATKYPIWLNGSSPGTSDWIVKRKACVNNFDGCCDKVYNVSVRHCFFFTVFCFEEIPSSCPQRFCLDIDLSKVTTTTTSTTTTTTTTMATGKPTNTGSSVVPHIEDDWSSKEAVIALAVCLVLAMFGILALVVAVYQLKTKNLHVMPNPHSNEHIIIPCHKS